MEVNKLVEILLEENKTISTMESCTGGLLASTITNVPGASEVLRFSAVTYSNEFKIKMGVDADVIDKYSVYSINTAMEMAKSISEFTLSDYGVGITGKLGRIDKNNLYGDNNTVFISLYDRENDLFYNFNIETYEKNREDNKKIVVDYFIEQFIQLRKNNHIKSKYYKI